MPPSVTPDSFEGISGEWLQVLARCATDTIFLTPLWQQVWWREMDSGDLRLLRVAEDGRLLGVAPLRSDGPLWHFLGDTSVFDYQDFIVSRGEEVPFFQALLDYLEREPWETLDLPSIPQGSPTLDILPSLARGRGWRVEVEEEDVTPGVALPGSWEEYLAGLNKKNRHELRRKLRRLQAAGDYRTNVVQDPGDISSAMSQFLQLMRVSRVDKEAFLTPEREVFFRSVGQELSLAGQVRLYFMEVGGARVAAAICFDYQGRRLLYNSGYDPRYASLSVGLLLKSICLRDAIEQGMEYFDFLRGSEPYKYDLGAQDATLYHLVLRR